MPTYQAINPLHTRVVDTDNLWWLGDAWNERTMEWFTADVLRFRDLLEGVFTTSHANIPEFLPSAEWVAEASRRTFKLSGEALTGVDVLQTAYALEKRASDPSAWQDSNTAKGAARVIAMLAPLNDDNFPLKSVVQKDSWGNVYIAEWLKKRTAIIQGLASNPSLPALVTPIDPRSKETPYRWLVKNVISSLEKKAGNEAILRLLVTNFGASTSDLEFALASLDEEAGKRIARTTVVPSSSQNDAVVRGLLTGTTVDYAAYYETISHHPNFVSWRTVDNPDFVSWRTAEQSQGDQGEALKRRHSKRTSAATFERIVLDKEYSKGRRATVPENPSKHSSWAVQQVVCESLLFDSKTGLSRRVTNRLRAATSADTNTEALKSSRRYVGYYAPVVGAVLASLDAKYGSADVPVEWMLAI